MSSSSIPLLLSSACVQSHKTFTSFSCISFASSLVLIRLSNFDKSGVMLFFISVAFIIVFLLVVFLISCIDEGNRVPSKLFVQAANRSCMNLRPFSVQTVSMEVPSVPSERVYVEVLVAV